MIIVVLLKEGGNLLQTHADGDPRRNSYVSAFLRAIEYLGGMYIIVQDRELN
jgi:hypothetical protein